MYWCRGLVAWLAGRLPAATRVPFSARPSGLFPWELVTVFGGAEPVAAGLVPLPPARTGVCTGASREQARAPAGREKVVLGRQSHPGAVLSSPWGPRARGPEEAEGAVLGAEVGLRFGSPGWGAGSQRHYPAPLGPQCGGLRSQQSRGVR